MASAQTSVPARVGVIGPADLVTLVSQVAAREFPTLKVHELAYRNEAQAVELVRGRSAEVEAWLFTGVIPYTLAQQAGVLDLPATYIPYTGATLYRLLVGLLSSGAAADTISIDTLDADQVVEAFRDASLPVDGVQIMEYRPGRDAAQFAEFHRAAAGGTGSSVAITCVRSVYDEIRGDLEAVRLAPAIASVRSALQTITLASHGRLGADAQVVIGFIDVSDPDPELADDITALAGSLFTLAEGRYLLITTRGVVEETTDHFQRLPLLDALARRHLWAHVGLGVGRSAAEAEALARRALARCRTAGPFSAAVSAGTGGDILLDATGTAETERTVPIGVAARRSGLSRDTLERLKTALERYEDGVTAGDIADALAIEPRTARRTLKQLERAGIARPIGRTQAGTAGRPRTIYRVRLG